MAEFQFNTALAKGPGLPANAATAAPTLGTQRADSQHGIMQYNSMYGNEGSALDAVPEFLKGLAQRKKDEAEQRAMWDGFTSARAGQTMQQIDEQQPWYANLFGPTDYELGAATFHVQKAGAEFDRSFTEAMPELRELDASQIGGKLNDMSNQQMTGNPYADDLIRQQMIQKAGPLMTAHTKERYAWQQGELSKARYGAWESVGAATQTALVADAKLNGGIPSPELLQERYGVIVKEHMYDGQSDPEMWKADLSRRVVDAARRGEFHTVTALSQAFGAMLPVEDQEKMETRVQAARAKYRANMPLDERYRQMIVDRAAIAAGHYSAQEAVDKLDDQNMEYYTLTGDTEPLHNMDDYVRAGGTALTMTHREAQRAMDRAERMRIRADAQGDKESALSFQAESVGMAIANGSAGVLALTDPSAKPMIELAFHDMIDHPNFPLLAVSNAVGDRPFKSSAVADTLRNRVNMAGGEDWSQGFETEYNRWKSIRDVQLPLPNKGVDKVSGVGTALALYGDEIHNKFLAYDSLISGSNGQDRRFAYMSVFGNEAKYGSGDTRGDNAAETRTNRATIMAYVTKDNPRFGKGLSRSSAEQVAWAASKHYATLSRTPGLTVEERARRAVEMVYSGSNMEKSGQYVWSNNNSDPLSAYLNMAPADFSRTFDQYLTGKLRAERVSVDGSTSTTIMRMGDDANGPRLLVQAQKPDGTHALIELTGKDLKEIQRRNATYQQLGQHGSSATARDDIGMDGFVTQPLL